MGVEKNVFKKINFQFMELSRLLLSWFDTNKRVLPFRENNNPYNVWVSEVMLQQTKVETVIPYFNAWIQKFPNINAVADAPEKRILKSWEGLGYYSRCRNFHRAAKIIVKEYNGRLPNNFEELKDWYNIPTPNFQKILDYQEFSEDVCRWMYILAGRMLFEVNELDTWQIMGFLKGRAKSGKSTIINEIIKKVLSMVNGYGGMKMVKKNILASM